PRLSAALAAALLACAPAFAQTERLDFGEDDWGAAEEAPGTSEAVAPEGASGETERLDFGEDDWGAAPEEAEAPGFLDRLKTHFSEGFEPRLISYRAYLQSELAFDARRDNRIEDTVFWRGVAYGETRLGISRHVKTFLSAKGEYVAAVSKEEDDQDTEFELREAYVDLDAGDVGPGRLYFRVGRQINSWGGNAFIAPADVLNPWDVTDFLELNPEDLRLPVFMARVDYQVKKFNLQFVYIPFFTPMEFDVVGTDFSIIRPNTAIAGLFSGAPGALDPRVLDLIQPLLFVDLDPPKDDLTDGEYGVRLTGTIGAVDFGLSYFATRRDFPIIVSRLPSPSAPFVSSRYPTQNVWGADVAWAVGGVTLKAETALTDRSYVQTAAPLATIPTADGPFTVYGTGARHFPALSSVIGAEYLIDSASQSIVSLEFNDRWNTGKTRDLLIEKEHNVFSVFVFRGSYWEDRIQPELRWIHVLSDDSFLLTPKLSYVHDGWLSLTLGGNWFHGRDDRGLGRRFPLPANADIFGLYEDNSQIFFATRVSF
ncbi:MAG: DUF1302 domain-containing protein, partial [Candidatus Methylomirabilis sp.]|nr:DUF1302 domain-containing protein [Deltaproteobacteria bacterium]